MGNNVTMISDLPDVSMLENRERGGRDVIEDKYQKFIRPSHKMNPESGMEYFGSPQSDMQQAPPAGMMQEPPPPVKHYMNFSCIDIAKHIQECPICSKFYNNDKTVYVIVIIVLSVVCLLLLKRVLNV